MVTESRNRRTRPLLAASLAALLAGATLAIAPAAAESRRAPRVGSSRPQLQWVADVGSAPYREQLTPGPTGPTTTLRQNEIDYVELGPAHYGQYTSAPYAKAGGRRVIWTQGNNSLVKLDAGTFGVLAELPFPTHKQWTADEFFTQYDALRTLPRDQQGAATLSLGAQTQSANGAYALLAKDNTFYVPVDRTITAYTDAVRGDPDSDIEVARTWDLPPETTGKVVGLTGTFDGWLMMNTEGGDLVALKPDFSESRTLHLPHADDVIVDASTGLPNPKPTNRNSLTVDESGGVFTVTNGFLHKVVWKGEQLSASEADGAWTEPYRNSTGLGSGSSPVLLGSSKDPDQLVVIEDGEPVMNVVAYWRNGIPKDARSLDGASSPRIAAQVRADIGDDDATAVQSEQSPVIAGYKMVLTDQSPTRVPPGMAANTRILVSGLLPDVPDFTPYGIQSFEWQPKLNELVERWTNTTVSPGNAFPLIDERSGTVYSVGVRDGVFTLEGFDLEDGKSRFHWNIGDHEYNNSFAAVYIDDQGRPMFGTVFGFVRLDVDRRP
jgi:hypothetical protein